MKLLAVWLIAAACFLGFYYGVSALGAATSPCLEMRWWGVHESSFGWHGHHKCLGGEEIDRR